MSIPVFIDLEPINQLSELRSYLRSKNVDIEEEVPENVFLEENLFQVITCSEQLWKEQVNESEVESIFNSIISLSIVLPHEQIEPAVSALCQQLKKPLPIGDKRNASKLKLLNNLFIGLDETSQLRYTTYLSLIQLAGQTDLLNLVNIKLDDVKKWMKLWQLDTPQYQALLRVLHEMFTSTKKTDQASKVMIELLGTYNEENAAQARVDARRCIATCIADPSVLLLDHLLLLKPVKFLEGEPIHDLVTIFVSGKLSQYLSFYEKHKDVISSNGLNHEDNKQKMRLLTFLSLVEGKNEVTYQAVQSELQLEDNQLEPFIINVIKSKAAKVKLVQTQKKIVVNSSINRTFGKPQWLQLKNQLITWQTNLNLVANGLQGITAKV
ncbi:hypothetical protein HELRODRAFT_185831 [Helobdella robusta]|uniref:Eukaryotic translation initiation factor 3 subunit M n=1 Tax=Helobdella robusta TaxID=6412 RepID=T1FNC5_HELRO|nr:hypothetical protein HELRODRAFT_185831 [Helobdella robusta]ESN98465.1 hypothetical protein HELRODRAFT_185831 [Helobdella robusta]